MCKGLNTEAVVTGNDEEAVLKSQCKKRSP